MRGLGFFCSVAALLAIASPVLAQGDIRESVSGFAPSYFAESRPPSALEMVNLLPGFRLQEADPLVRGYSGAVGNVLIDGRPPASKQDKLEDILKRIPAASVERIELVRAGASGVDMQGYALLANVVRKVNNAPRGRMEFETRYFAHYDMAVPRLAAEYSLGSTQILDLSAAVYRMVNEAQGGLGHRDRLAQDRRTPIRIATSDGHRYEDDWTISGTYRQPLLGGQLRINGLFKETRNIFKSLEIQTFPLNTRAPGLDRTMLGANEAGLQYERGLWEGGEAEVIAIRRGTSEHNAQSVFQAAGTDSTFKHAHSSETIARASLRQRSGDFTLEAGGETALNTLDNRLAFVQSGVVINLPGANVRISERRSEFFGTATWRPISALTLESGLRYEMSTLKQQGDSTLNKDLAFLKPRVMASWKPDPADEIRLLYERQAGQLDFINFVPVIMLSSNQIVAGNANLEPYTLWNTEAAWEHRFTAGSLVLTARRQDISNVVDRVGIPSPQGTFDGVGNIGNGRRDEYQVDFLMPLDDLHLSGMTLQSSFLRRFTKVTDPTTLFRRGISMDPPVEAKVALTHNLPAWQMRWGVTYTHSNDRWSYKFNEIKDDKTAESFDAFVEYKPAPQWLVRLAGKNLLDRPIVHDRNIWRTPRGPGATYNYFEKRAALIGVNFGITIQRQFGD